MISRFFIHRPIFAGVLAIFMVLAGLLAIEDMGVAQYPDLTPPTVQVSASYPGADAETIAQTVGVPIEEQVNGVDGMIYMSSTSSSSGTYNLTVTFDVGTDPDMATVLVQNRVNIAQPTLPQEVMSQGVTTQKQSSDIISMVALTSSSKSIDALFLSNYAYLYLRDELARLPGVGNVQIFGADEYSMRVWLNPEQLKYRGLTASDVMAAIQDQNVQVAAGQVGASPAPAGQVFQYTVTTRGRLSDPDEFANIVLKTGADGQVVRLGDVARVELGAKSNSVVAELSGEPAAFIATYLSPGANALNVQQHIEAKMAELAKAFPEGIKWSTPYDTTTFVKLSVEEVVQTLVEAFLLVFAVILIFLQNWRVTMIPAIAIPVSIIGTFFALEMVGFSINLITLFGLVLAIAIVVDDAIVVVENVSRNMEEGLPVVEATEKAMQEVTGPIIATTLVLMSVFVPASFLGGTSGEIFRNFALTIAFSALLSAINSLTLSPALCAVLLRPHDHDAPKNFIYRGFNALFGRVTGGYNGLIRMTVRRAGLMMLLYLGVVGLAGWGFLKLPTGSFPTEDQGYAIASVNLPAATSLERTREAVNAFVEQLRGIDGIANVVAVTGFSLIDGANASNSATVWITYTPWDDRLPRGITQDVLLAEINKAGYMQPQAQVMAFPPPAISGIGTSGGVEMRLEDRGAIGYANLAKAAQEAMAMGLADPRFSQVYTTINTGIPQLFAEVDRSQVKTMNVPLADVYSTMQAYLGQYYVNQFDKFGRVYQVNIQAEPGFRSTIEDITRLEVRNAAGDMVPLGAVVAVEERAGPQTVIRYNNYPAAIFNGTPVEGVSEGEALTALTRIAGQAGGSGVGFDYTGMSYQLVAQGNQAIIIFALAILFVYLVLSAQYESWGLSLAVVLAAPLALFGTVVALMMRSLDFNMYSQIGVVLLIALAAKNAILIVEFAKEIREQGKTVRQAAMEAAHLRFRPILMTSFAFIFGVLPLVLATGAGAASRVALGTAVFGGMIAGTVLAVIFVPSFYTFIESLRERTHGEDPDGVQPLTQSR